ncbi:MAG: FxLYD domain-containing protein [Anaerolineae bacterium]|jgi:LysM repeat protein
MAPSGGYLAQSEQQSTPLDPGRTLQPLFDFRLLFCYNLARRRNGDLGGCPLRRLDEQERNAKLPRAVFGIWLTALLSLALAGCGRVLDPPKPTAVAGIAPTHTDTPNPTATRRATFTPVPATPSDTPTPTVTPTPIIYIIKKGDTLLAVAREFDVTVKDIQEVNGIADPRRLQIGQEIIIPRKPAEGEPTSVPTPTPVALQIRGLAFHRTPVDSLWCMGEVANLSGRPVEEVQVRVSLHDEQGRLLASGAAFTQLDILAPGGRAPFAILFAAPPTSFAQYQTQVLSGVPSTHLGPRYPDLAVVEDWGGWLDSSQKENYQVRGQVHNTGDADAEQVALVVTLYDDEDHVVGARTVSIAPDVFLAGAMAPFEVTLTPLRPAVRYDIQVQGWWIGYQVPTATGTPEATAAP